MYNTATTLLHWHCNKMQKCTIKFRSVPECCPQIPLYVIVIIALVANSSCNDISPATGRPQTHSRLRRRRLGFCPINCAHSQVSGYIEQQWLWWQAFNRSSVDTTGSIFERKLMRFISTFLLVVGSLVKCPPAPVYFPLQTSTCSARTAFI